jgi:hypothetical protein
MAGGSRTRRQLLSPRGSGAAADTGWLERLLSIELLTLYTYEHVLGSSILPPAARRTLAPVLAHERAHVAALHAQVSRRGGHVPPPPPSIATANRYLARRQLAGRLGHLRGAPDALYLLLSVERVTIGAYFVALRELRDTRLILLATQIMASDAQHEAIIGRVLHPGDTPDAVPYGLVQGLQ